MAARNDERNPIDLNIKPTLHDRIASKFYKPYYLNPFGHNDIVNLPSSRSYCLNRDFDKIPDIQKNVNKRAFIMYKPAAMKNKKVTSDDNRSNEQLVNSTTAKEMRFKLTVDKFRRSL